MSERIRSYISAKMIILEGDRILMGQECAEGADSLKCHWEVPGGSILPPENAVECLKREAKEELGADIFIEDSLPFFFCFPGKIFGDKYAGSYWQMIYFLCSLDGALDIEQATDTEFVDIEYIGKQHFMKLSEGKRIMACDRESVPPIMKKLGVW